MMRQLLALTFLAFALPAAAQTYESVIIKVGNSGTTFAVPLDLSGPNIVDRDHNIHVTCQSDGDGGCLGMLYPPAIKANVTQWKFTAGGTITNSGRNLVTAPTTNASVTVKWTSTDAAVCVGTSTPAVANWNDVAVPLSGTRVLSLPNSSGVNKSYALRLTCYSRYGSEPSKTINATVTAP